MTTVDIQNLASLIRESNYQGIESSQTSRRTPVTVDSRNSTIWSGITDPAKGGSTLTPSVDEEQPCCKDSIKKMVQHELDNAPPRMTYASRVLIKILKYIDSL